MSLQPIYLLVFMFLVNNSGPKLNESNGSVESNFPNESIPVELTDPDISAIQENCKYKNIPLYGKVKFVESFPDIKIQFVESFADINVKFVSSFPNDCGKWQVVESFPDFTVQVVESFPDIKVKTVDSFPGM